MSKHFRFLCNKNGVASFADVEITGAIHEIPRYFVVVRGRSIGIHESWEDTYNSISFFREALYFECSTLEKAETAKKKWIRRDRKKYRTPL